MASRNILGAAAAVVVVLLAAAAAPQVRRHHMLLRLAGGCIAMFRVAGFNVHHSAVQVAAAAAGVAELEARAGQLRSAVAAHPSSFEAALELASTLHQLDHSAPNGGKRVPEAAAAYRRAAELAPQPEARAAVLSNLAALLLAGGRVRRQGMVVVLVRQAQPGTYCCSTWAFGSQVAVCVRMQRGSCLSSPMALVRSPHSGS